MVKFWLKAEIITIFTFFIISISITKELIFGFQILELKGHFSASLIILVITILIGVLIVKVSHVLKKLWTKWTELFVEWLILIAWLSIQLPFAWFHGIEWIIRHVIIRVLLNQPKYRLFGRKLLNLTLSYNLNLKDSCNHDHTVIVIMIMQSWLDVESHDDSWFMGRGKISNPSNIIVKAYTPKSNAFLDSMSAELQFSFSTSILDWPSLSHAVCFQVLINSLTVLTFNSLLVFQR